MDRETGRFRLEGLMPGVSFETVAQQTGFDFDGAIPVPELRSPSPDELDALHAVDPDRVRDVEFH
jgi:hypothetical protein